jgi:N-acetylmuramoyl-L-alanine amidase CwlA
MYIKIFGTWDFYHWGKGWDSEEQAHSWNKFWHDFNESHPDSHWRYVEIGKGCTQEHLLVCGQCVVCLHPMNYTAYFRGSGVSVLTVENGKWVTRREFILEELEEICKEVAKACNGTYKHKEVEIEISIKE